METLTFEPLINPALWTVLAVCTLGLLVIYARRRPAAVRLLRWSTICALMFICAACVLTILANPTWVSVTPPPEGKPVLTVLIDASASMATCDDGKPDSRYSAAARAAEEIIRNNSDEFDVNVATFASDVRAVQPAHLAEVRAEGDITSLAGAIAGSLRSEQPQGRAVVLLSDGIHNAEGGTDAVLDVVRHARAAAVPIFTQTFGSSPNVKDISLVVRSPQEMSFVGQKVECVAEILQTGYSGAAVDVVLTSDGKEHGRQRVALAAGSGQSARFEVERDKAGLYHYQVRAEPLLGEHTTRNNVASFLLRTADRPTRVLLLEGKPYWDGKFLIRTLSADPSIELDAVVRMAPGRFMKRSIVNAVGSQPDGSEENGVNRRTGEWEILQTTHELLGAIDKLREYNVIVVGRDADEFLTDATLTPLRKWIAEEGGSLVCYRGSPTATINERLARLLPVQADLVRESRFRMKLTPSGHLASWLLTASDTSPETLWSLLPTLATNQRAAASKPASVVLATAADASGGESAAVVYQPYGTGRVVYIEGAGMWRWGFLPPEHEQYHAVYHRMWRNMIRWLVANGGLLPGENVSLRPDKVTFSDLEPVGATMLLRADASFDTVPVVEVRAEGASKSDRVSPIPVGDEPGVFRVTLGRMADGHYELKAVAAREESPLAVAAFDVRPSMREQMDLKARPDLMARIASESGGVVLTGRADEVSRTFKAHLARTRLPIVERTTAWDRWWVFGSCIAAWGLTWALRRSSGLI
ncbi:MAG: hypothetical protein IPK83_18470 [Planctomycetes bacterium]|nr:hypothetical protein [Planctomycetota bacterium]